MTLTDRKYVWCLVLILWGSGPSLLAGTFTAFGPQDYTRGTGAPVTVSNTFSVLNPNTQYILKAFNGGLQNSQTELVSSTVVTVNGVQVLGPNNFNQQVNEVDVPVTLQGSNTLSVQVRGQPGGVLTIEIIGVDNDLPVITASPSPSPDAFGWNNTDVVVTFTCSDKTSGVASCPAPVTVSTEGANQSISGTAADKAGNTASVSVNLNIDKTPPIIIASISPQPNAAGWNNTDVTVSFQCSDSLSGVATCPPSQTINTEGTNQTISGTATDVAGNSANATATINLDKTPPVISISSPANNAVSSTPNLQITGTATDALSGVAATTCNGSAAVFQGTSFSCSVNLGPGANAITVATTDVAGNSSSQSLTVSLGPAITDFNPKSASVGGLITVSGSGFTSGSGTPQVALSSQTGGTIVAPVASFTATTLSFVVPDGAASGVLTITVSSQTVTSAASLNIIPASGFSITVGPSLANLIQGQAVNFAITLSSSNGFNQLALLSVSGVPSGVSSKFAPPQITAGQTSLLTLSAPANQVVGSATLKVTASASVNGIAVSQSANVSLNVQPVATTFLGRASVDDTLQTPLSGVTVAFMGQDGMGGTTSCSGQTQSDTAGNFSFTNLPAGCTGEQLIRYDGINATTASDRNAGTPVQYAGVDLSYNIAANQVTTPPNVIRLPRIDNKETVLVAQNSSQDQTFTFKTIPNLSVTVYAGTTFTLADGSQPNPFPLIAIDVPVDRLPDEMPDLPTTVGAFIVAFQPANSVASQPVAVYFPNTLNTPPGTNMPLETLNPTIGMMVRYGTGTVSSNGAQIVPDLDPAHPNHRFGLVHFDWHRAVIPTPNQTNPGPEGCSCGDPVDLFSGIQVITAPDISISGSRGSISIVRTYRSLTSNTGPFGIGTSHNYGYRLDLTALLQEQGVINLIMPDGNQYPFSQQLNGTFVNTTIPAFAGAVLSNVSGSTYNLRWKNGTIYQFSLASQGGPRISFLTSMIDPNGNKISLTLDPAGNFLQVTDPVGRSLTLSYDGASRITTIADPIGRTVRYTYNSQGTLASVTNPAGGVTQYTYDGQNRLLTVTDPRGIVQAQNTLDANGRVIQQLRPDGGQLTFNYANLNPDAPNSPIMFTTVTDNLGRSVGYRFNPVGFLAAITPLGGELETIQRASGTNLVQSVTKANSTQSVTYDANGNVLTSTDPLGNTTAFTYEPVFNKIATVIDALGNKTSFTYDLHGNLLTQTDANGHTTALAYSSFGQLTQITDPLGQKTTLGYDGFGNLVSVSDPLGNTTSMVYDAVSRPVQVIDALGRKSQAVYDALNRVTKQVNAQGNATQFSYDANNNLLSLTDANGNTTSFSYDPMNRLLTRTDPLGKSDARTYDIDGNLTQFVDRRGQSSKFIYDILNRLTESDYQDSTVTRVYDALDRLIHVSDSASGEFDFAYDLAGQLLGSVNPVGTVQYGYDADGRTTTRQVAGQPALQYSYDPVGNLLSAALPQASALFTYNARNQLLNINRANGVTSQYQYDQAGRLLSLVHFGSSSVLNAQSYVYDAVGNRISYTTNIAQPLITQAVNGSAFDAGNRLLQSDASFFSYDANGNLISRSNSTGTTNFTWDGRNRLISVSGLGAFASFQYDFSGDLLMQSVNGRPRTYVVDDLTNIAVLNDNGDQEQILSGTSIDQHLALVHSTGQVEYGLADAIGSTSAVVDAGGRKTSSFFYDPFGQTTSTEAGYPFQFTGRQPIAANLYYYRSRFYDSSMDRFISEDPLGVVRPNVNSYKYASNNPLTNTDPTGLSDQIGHCSDFVGGGLTVACAFVPKPGDTICGLVSPYFSHSSCGERTFPLSCEDKCAIGMTIALAVCLADPPVAGAIAIGFGSTAFCKAWCAQPPPYELPPAAPAGPFTPPYISGGNATANVPPQLPQPFQIQLPQNFQLPPEW